MTEDVLDIYDGQVFANLMEPGSFLSCCENVGLILCTDYFQSIIW